MKRILFLIGVLLMLISLSAFADSDAEEANKILTYGRYFVDLVGAASIIASVTPTPKDDKIIGRIVKLIDVLGFNVLFAKNKR